MFFSLWLNNIGSQMIVFLHPLPLDNPNATDAISQAENFSQMLYKSSLVAIRLLERSLRSNESDAAVAFPRDQNRRMPYWVKTSGPKDDFIFFSNVLPVDFESHSFNITVEPDRGTYRNIPRGPSFAYFMSHHIVHAVDNDNRTCWRPHRSVEQGDYFGIDLLRIQTDAIVSLVIEHDPTLQRSLEVRVSFDGVVWLSHPSLQDLEHGKAQPSDEQLLNNVIDASRFPREFRSFRYISFLVTHPSSEIFRVCDIRLVKRTKTKGRT